MKRRRIGTAGPLGALTAVLIALATAAPADDAINRMIGAEDIGTGHASAPLADTPVSELPPGIAPDAAGTDSAQAGSERWLTGAGAISALSIVTVHPLPGEECRDVLFDMRPSERVRHEATVDETMELDLGNLCLFGIRNDSDNRAIAIRLGEELRTVAIGIDSRLQSGLTIGPGHEVLTPIRPMSLDEVEFTIEVVWDDLIDSGKAEASAFRVRMTADPEQGS